MSKLSEKLSWDDLRVVRSIAETCMPSEAARLMGVNNSTIVRRLAQVEEAIGTPLFDRRRSGYVPTAAGELVIKLAGRIELDLTSLGHQLSEETETGSGLIRLATSDSLLQAAMPVIRDFRAQHPGIQIEVIAGNGALNLARGECDVALRATCNPPENLVGRKIAQIEWAPFGRIDQDVGASLHDHAWVSYAGSLAGLKAAAFLAQRTAPQQIVYRSDTVLGVASAVREGIGLGYLPCMLGDRLEGVSQVGEVEKSLSDELWLLTHPDIRYSHRVRAFMTFFSKAFSIDRG
ncbi:LysR family transcriptional regulator [Novosphingobium sp. ZW T3_23]|uniref:LysR family transcriptional regulator n=1 Tax=Novosphingobium sp. ZW T3_23 TaxID=3378084 RepID=UPI0038539491